MKAYVTKYALTVGIERLEGEVEGGMFMVIRNGFMNHYHGEGREWHRTLDSALAQAEKLRERKLVALRKQQEKLEKMVFECREE